MKTTFAVAVGGDRQCRKRPPAPRNPAPLLDIPVGAASGGFENTVT